MWINHNASKSTHYYNIPSGVHWISYDKERVTLCTGFGVFLIRTTHQQHHGPMHLYEWNALIFRLMKPGHSGADPEFGKGGALAEKLKNKKKGHSNNGCSLPNV